MKNKIITDQKAMQGGKVKVISLLPHISSQSLEVTTVNSLPDLLPDIISGHMYWVKEKTA